MATLTTAKTAATTPTKAAMSAHASRPPHDLAAFRRCDDGLREIIQSGIFGEEALEHGAEQKYTAALERFFIEADADFLAGFEAVDEDGHALSGEDAGNARARSAVRTGDERHLALEAQIHNGCVLYVPIQAYGAHPSRAGHEVLPHEDH